MPSPHDLMPSSSSSSSSSSPKTSATSVPPTPVRDEKQHMWQLAGIYSAVGIEVAACVVLGAVGGHYADAYLQTTPWLFFFGTGVGCTAAVRALRRVVAQSRERSQPGANDAHLPR